MAKIKKNIEEDEKIPLLGFSGFIDIFLIICGSLAIIFTIIGNYDQAAMFLAIGVLFYFARVRLRKIYDQKTIIRLSKLSVYVALGLSPVILLISKINSQTPQSVLIFIPALLAFIAVTVNVSKDDSRLDVSAFAVAILILYIFYSIDWIGETFTVAVLFFLGILLLFSKKQLEKK